METSGFLERGCSLAEITKMAEKEKFVGVITDVLFSPDGQYLYTGRSIFLYKLSTELDSF